ncbi:hypothetical protein MLD38_011133 [Melastoma candidum]|uniref:Uncharacterized protein n=1 Tax=Melastoma candidum TaxID=119954 RepID=A0ACB9R239_9MYRT|nr:hypothetical protein MLD38_011133 [Melastoma candidum]
MPDPPKCGPAEALRRSDGNCGRSSSNHVGAADLEAVGERAGIERECRICQLSLDAGDNAESGVALVIELGCSCKDDLAAAHKLCAEAWFNIKGNKTCEICGSTARNVDGENEVESTARPNTTSDSTTAAVDASAGGPQNRRFWEGHRFLNFMLGCIVFAFVISWLFHFHIPSKY